MRCEICGINSLLSEILLLQCPFYSLSNSSVMLLLCCIRSWFIQRFSDSKTKFKEGLQASWKKYPIHKNYCTQKVKDNLELKREKSPNEDGCLNLKHMVYAQFCKNIPFILNQKPNSNHLTLIPSKWDWFEWDNKEMSKQANEILNT